MLVPRPQTIALTVSLVSTVSVQTLPTRHPCAKRAITALEELSTICLMRTQPTRSTRKLVSHSLVITPLWDLRSRFSAQKATTMVIWVALSATSA